MQRRLRALIRRPVSDEFLLKHVVSISLGQIVLSNVDRVMQAVSLGYSTGHGMPQSEMLGMPTHRMYTEESERLWQTSHDHGFYRGEVASGWLFPAGRPEC